MLGLMNSRLRSKCEGRVEVIKPFIYRSINRARLENKLSVEGMTVKQEEENIRSRCRRGCCKEKYK